MNIDVDDGHAVAQAVAAHINRGGRNEGDFVDGMSRQHRTLQQGFTQLCLDWLRHLASLEDGQYDLRNEYSVTVAKAVAPVIDETLHGARTLPVI